MTEDITAEQSGAVDTGAYRVLARKYRPTNFSELIGQDALVRTLTNAIRSGRLAHAFMLTGVRGVGKTTTARIIARALNCVGPDGTGGPTVDPCGVCEQCRSITQDRNVDVLEMDAASNNSVANIREVIDSVRYGPVSSRYKIYIIDEVHMLSTAAFNALLKTLEEPPEHTKFIFATTEIRKVPITVLSRCQRFDLRRVESQVLVDHFARVASREGVEVDADALALIARAADGSVRDGMSLLDQAIALGGDRVDAVQVRDMLGLADRTVVVDLFEAAVTGDPGRALGILDDLHRSGADPLVVIQDMLDFTHFLTRLKVVAETATDPGTPEAERVRGGALAAKLSMPALTRAWQMLLKGVGEVQAAPVPHQAAEMILIRLAYAAHLPSPAELVRQFRHAAGTGEDATADGAPPASPVAASAVSSRDEGPPQVRTTGAQDAPERIRPTGGGQTVLNRAGGRGEAAVSVAPSSVAPASEPRIEETPPEEAPPEETPEPATEAPPAVAQVLPDPRTFRDLVDLFRLNREGALYGHLHSGVHLVRFEPGRLEIRPGPMVPPNLSARVSALLGEWTGKRWMVTVSSAPGEPTLMEQDRAYEARAREEAANHPVVRAVLEQFPGARIEQVRDLALEMNQSATANGALAQTVSDDDVIADYPSDPDEEGET